MLERLLKAKKTHADDGPENISDGCVSLALHEASGLGLSIGLFDRRDHLADKRLCKDLIRGGARIDALCENI